MTYYAASLRLVRPCNGSIGTEQGLIGLLRTKPHRKYQSVVHKQRAKNTLIRSGSATIFTWCKLLLWVCTLQTLECNDICKFKNMHLSLLEFKWSLYLYCVIFIQKAALMQPKNQKIHIRILLCNVVMLRKADTSGDMDVMSIPKNTLL